MARRFRCPLPHCGELIFPAEVTCRQCWDLVPIRLQILGRAALRALETGTIDFELYMVVREEVIAAAIDAAAQRACVEIEVSSW